MADYDLNHFSTERPNASANGQDCISCSEYERKKLRRKRIRRQPMIFTAVILSILALLILIIVLICKSYSNGDNPSSIKGIYVYENNTEYEFDGKENGCMCVLVDGEKYYFEYTYKIKENQLYIDFENEEVTDITYEYSLDGDKLTLVGKEGSAGGTYTLTKKL